MVDTNKKLPKHGWDDGEIVPKYGTTYGHQDLLGSHRYVYANPAEPDKYSFQELNATGSYIALQFDKDKKEITTMLHPGHTYKYTGGGESTHTDGHQDTNVASTRRDNTMGDHGVSCKTDFKVATEGAVHAVNEFFKFFTTSKSESKSFYGSYGDNVNEHSGHWHESFEKDHVQAVAENKITMVQGGDYAIHVQKGNYDTHIAEKGRIYADNDILIESKTKITLKVGSSKIVIDGSSIQIIANGKSGRIDLN